MKGSKKLLRLLLALLLVCSLLPGGKALAEEPPQTYSVTVEGGTAFDFESGAPVTEAAPDTLLYVEAEYPEDCYLKEWTVEPEDLSIGDDGSFTMPASPVTIRFFYAEQQKVTVDLTEGSFTITEKEVLDGFLQYWDETDFKDGEERCYDLDGDGTDDIKVSFFIVPSPDPDDPEDPDKVTLEYSAEFEALDTNSISDKYELFDEGRPYVFLFLFSAETYTVSFDPNGGTGAMEPRTVKKGEKLTLPDCEFTPPENREFDKWDVGSPGDEIEVTGDMTVKAIWKGPAPVTYTVTFDPDGGTGTMGPRTVKKGAKLTLPDCEFTPPEGKTFDSWDVGAPGEQIEVTGDTTVKAVWKWLNYTVTFETGGGSIVPTQVIQHGNVATKPVNPTQEGYVFEGWFTDKECKEAFDFETPITENLTLYAKWKEVPVYEVAEGANGAWTKGSKIDKRFVVVRTPKNETIQAHFQGVAIDGKTLTKDVDYKVEPGLAVTIKAVVLQKLPAGNHTVTFLFDDGQAGTKLTIRAGTGGPRTGDESTAVWVVLLAASGLALAGGAFYFIRKRRQGKAGDGKE